MDYEIKHTLLDLAIVVFKSCRAVVAVGLHI